MHWTELIPEGERARFAALARDLKDADENIARVLEDVMRKRTPRNKAPKPTMTPHQILDKLSTRYRQLLIESFEAKRRGYTL